MSKAKPKARKPKAAAVARHPADPQIVADTIYMILELPDASYRLAGVQRELANLWHLIPEEFRRCVAGAGFPRARATWIALADALVEPDVGEIPREPIGFKADLPPLLSKLERVILQALAASPNRLTREDLAGDSRVTEVARDPKSIRSAINTLLELDYVEEPYSKGQGLSITPAGRAYLDRFALAPGRSPADPR